jgi:SnoaL-like domain
MSDQTAALQTLLDKQEITELLTRYLRSVDRGDVDTLRGCYLPEATEDHGGLFAGPAVEYVDSITRDLTHPRARTSHNMTNLLIELNGDVATAESYCITFARIKADGSYYHSFIGARMIDRLERRDGRWASRTASSSGTGTTTPPPPSTGCRACSPPTPPSSA